MSLPDTFVFENQSLKIGKLFSSLLGLIKFEKFFQYKISSGFDERFKASSHGQFNACGLTKLAVFELAEKLFSSRKR